MRVLLGGRLSAFSLLILFFFWAAVGHAQNQPSPLVTQAVDDTQLAPLQGTVHPLTLVRYDRGPVNESTPAERLLLVLNRPADRDAAFRQFVKDAHTRGSARWHKWLTPEQIGAQFGPADSDVEAVRMWLGAAGFSVNRVSKSKRFVEFSGTVGQVNAAFHTQIHAYLVNGTLHHANATAIEIPAALTGIVAGVSSLSDFRPVPQLESGGTGEYDAASRRIVPDLTGPASWSPLKYALAPADFATEYDLAPLAGSGVTGAGATIGIINESNIDLSQQQAYRSIFGLPANPVQVVIDGSDPGTNSASTEAYLDVEMAGAAAPGATVDLYISAGSPYQDPLALAAMRAIEDDQADILSVSFGAGEQELEASGNQLWNALWEQAAAQGQTVLVAAGDYGQVPDENYWFEGLFTGPAVNGLASTPWNIAVGGTDFYYSDYAGGAPSADSDWNATNDPTTKASLIARLPEQVWNDAFGLDAIGDGLERNEFYAGGGGASSCITTNSSGCAGSYAKPAWQTGPGVPAGGARDIPDVSLFASNGANLSADAICAGGGECTPDSSGNFSVDLVGGTSASTPAMAGIMALVVQKYGRQGQADTTLYPLAQQKPSAFHDITLGNNQDLCADLDAECVSIMDSSGQTVYESTVYAAAPGFDMASGLGSVDAANLVNNWNTVTFQSTSTTLQIAPAKITHGASVNITAGVAPASGTGTPTGAVAILSASDSSSSQGQTVIQLAGGTGSASLNSLPGGSYELTARYSGDGVFAGSTSQPQPLTVEAEKSTLAMKIAGANNASITQLTYGMPIYLSAQVVGVNAPQGGTDGSATGAVTFTLDGAATTVPLNAGGIASWIAPVLSVGTHTVSASYAGDSSFEASSAAAQNFSLAQGFPYINLNPSFAIGGDGIGDIVYAGGSITVGVQVGSYYGAIFENSVPSLDTPAPTGTVTVKLANGNSDLFGIGCAAASSAASQTATLAPTSGTYAEYSSAQEIFTNLPAGFYYLCAIYNGDANWGSASLAYTNQIIVTAPTTPPAASTTTLSISPTSVSGAQTAALTATVIGPAGATVAPTGYVSFSDNGSIPEQLWLYSLTPAASGASSSFTLDLPASYFWANGTNQLTAVYSGDGNYLPSTSNQVNVAVAQNDGDFTLTPELAQVSVASGSSASADVDLVSLNGFSGTVALSCATSSSSFSCAVSPASPTLNGSAQSMVTITATKPASTTASAGRSPRGGSDSFSIEYGATLSLAVLLLLPVPGRKWRLPVSLIVLCIFLFSAGCGGSGVKSTPPSNPNGTPAGAYNVVITGTGNGIVHDAKLTVVVTGQ
jgi:hypothetical protein